MSGPRDPWDDEVRSGKSFDRPFDLTTRLPPNAPASVRRKAHRAKPEVEPPTPAEVIPLLPLDLAAYRARRATNPPE